MNMWTVNFCQQSVRQSQAVEDLSNIHSLIFLEGGGLPDPDWDDSQLFFEPFPKSGLDPIDCKSSFHLFCSQI